jgi:hypothetical protein
VSYGSGWQQKAVATSQPGKGSGLLHKASAGCADGRTLYLQAGCIAAGLQAAGDVRSVKCMHSWSCGCAADKHTMARHVPARASGPDVSHSLMLHLCDMADTCVIAAWALWGLRMLGVAARCSLSL